ncbi:MAG TPA: saccharopine dehydrogenase NADP-binding domain-containing protein [Jatrophihabitantaceae bacterium]|nr:saccharopine dehydrogenase NADP-binding domain-containing protein [Jatrophihabitantaceae bacterium]
MADRDYDIVLFGATGFAGRLTAEYLARTAPPGCRWAIAGRNLGKLEGLRDDLKGIDPAVAEIGLVQADVDDAASLRRVAEAARVVITTVGPYVLFGQGLVAACAEAGTDYLDLTGEPEFINTTYVRHHATAQRSGARLVHSAGFDSIPHDLGAYFTVLQLPEDVPLKVEGFVRTSAMFSGGTFYSALTGFSRPRANMRAARARKAAEAPATDRAARAVPGRVRRNPVGDGWVVPLPTIDPQVVARSARAVERYGPDFTYSHYAAVKHLPTAIGAGVGVAGVMGLAQVPPARKLLLSRIRPGEGPSPEKRARSWFAVTFVGEGGGERVVTRVSGGDPGYDETAKMLAESALSLAFDDLPPTSGQVTTVAAMGDALLGRLQRAGIQFEILPS